MQPQPPRAAMDLLQRPAHRKLGKVAADGFGRHAKAFGQRIDCRLSLAGDNVKDAALALLRLHESPDSAQANLANPDHVNNQPAEIHSFLGALPPRID
jgi:hypothetical protein